MDNFDPPERFQYDPPEPYEAFVERETQLLFARELTGQQVYAWTQQAYQEWEQQEAKKVQYQQKLAREAKEHESAVERLKIQIEKEKGRIRLEEMRKREREARELQRKSESEAKELQRKLEREAEQERRDPTPQYVSPEHQIAISRETRSYHIFMPGATGQGKSSQMFHLIMSDINEGHAVAVLDPKGDLVRRLCAYIPEKDLSRCVYLDVEHPVPLDILGKSGNPEFLIQDIKNFIIKGNKTLEQAGPRLSRLIYCLLQIQDSSFIDIEYFFTRPKRKEQILASLRALANQRWYEMCEAELAHLKPNDYQPITGRMTEFTLNESLHTIMGHPTPLLNINDLIKQKKIVLINLAGTGEPREVFGTVLMSLYQQAALLRSTSDPRYFIPEGQRPPICFFVDEFEDFQNPSFATVYSKARGLGLHITVGVQYIGQLISEDRRSIIGNSGSNIIFHLEEDLNLFENKIRPYQTYRIGQLERYQAIFKIIDQTPIFKWTKAPPPFTEKESHLATGIIKTLIQQTQDAYGWAACDRRLAAPSATTSQNRSGDNSSSIPPENPHDKGDGTIHPTGAPRDKTL
jgi:hypothetical protein